MGIIDETIRLEKIFSFKYISEVLTYLEQNDFNYTLKRNNNFLTLDTSFATFDAFENNLRIIHTVPRKNV